MSRSPSGIERPLIEREHELDAFDDVLDRLRAGGPGVVLVEGPAPPAPTPMRRVS